MRRGGCLFLGAAAAATAMVPAVSVAGALPSLAGASVPSAGSVAAVPFTLIDRSPESMAAPGTLTARFQITGGETDSWTAFYVQGTVLKLAGYTDPVWTMNYPTVKITQGPARESGRGSYGVWYPPTCARGGTMIDLDDAGYTIIVPAHSTSVMTVSGRVPQGFKQPAGVDALPANAGSGQVGFTITSGTLQPYIAQPGVAFPVTQVLPGGAAIQTTISAYRTSDAIDGATITLKATPAGDQVASGHLLSRTPGVRVDIVGRVDPPTPGLIPIGRPAYEAFGSQESVQFPPGRHAIQSFGHTQTTKGGQYRIHINAPHAALAYARVTAHGRRGTNSRYEVGESCPIAVPPTATAG